jgi:hypothetical protein
MEAVLRRSAAVPWPRSAREVARSTAAALRRRIAKRFYRLAELSPSASRELPPEWFRYPLP